MGTSHPFLLKGASFRYGWVIGCQPRRDTDEDGRVELHIGRHGETFGDDLEPYLFRGPGPGEAITRFLGRSPGGRYLVIEADSRLVVDAATGRDFDLTALGSYRAEEGTPSRLDFSSRHQVAFVREQDRIEEVVVLDLQTRALEVVRRLARETLLYDVAFSEDGRTLVVHEVSRDTNGNGRLDRPVVRSNLRQSRCSASPQSYSTYGMSGDEPDRIEIPLPESPNPTEEVEKLEYEFGCLEDGRPALARSSSGAVLVASGAYLNTEFGPIEWSKSQVSRAYCDHSQKIAPCDASGVAAGSTRFCATWELPMATSRQIAGAPPDWVAVASRKVQVLKGLRVPSAETDIISLYDDLSGSSFENVWALSDEGLSLFDGQRWTTAERRVQDLRRVAAVNPTLAWAYGDRGRVSRWDGHRWSVVDLPETSPVLSLWSDTQRAWASTSLRTFEWDGHGWRGRPGTATGAIIGLSGAGDAIFGITSEGELVRWAHPAWQVVARLVSEKRRFMEQLLDVAAASTHDVWGTTSFGRLWHWNGARLESFDAGTRVPLDRILKVTDDSVWLSDGTRLIRFRR